MRGERGEKVTQVECETERNRHAVHGGQGACQYIDFVYDFACGWYFGSANRVYRSVKLVRAPREERERPASRNMTEQESVDLGTQRVLSLAAAVRAYHVRKTVQIERRCQRRL